MIVYDHEYSDNKATVRLMRPSCKSCFPPGMFRWKITIKKPGELAQFDVFESAVIWRPEEETLIHADKFLKSIGFLPTPQKPTVKVTKLPPIGNKTS